MSIDYAELYFGVTEAHIWIIEFCLSVMTSTHSDLWSTGFYISFCVPLPYESYLAIYFPTTLIHTVQTR